jgi:hypothetical protein
VVDVAGSVETVAVAGGAELAREGSVSGVRLRGRGEARQPRRVGKGVGVEEGHEVAVRADPEGHVVRRRETHVRPEPDRLRGGIRGKRSLERAVGAPVVHHEHPVGPPLLARERQETGTQVVAAVPVDDHDRDLHGRATAT